MYTQIAANKRRTVLIMAGFLGFVLLLSWVLGEYVVSPTTAYFILSIGIIYAVVSYFAGSRTALALNGATEITKTDNPRLWRIVENLSITDGLQMPRVYIINDPAPNAFATGRDPQHAAICATSGLLDMMSDTELQSVFAHELGHVKNYDIRVCMIAFALVAAVAVIADTVLRFTFFGIGGRGRGRQAEGQAGAIIMIIGIVAAVLAPIIATLIELAVSRQREYLADATSALTTRYPEGLISALEKIDRSGSALKRQNTATAHLFFVNPLRNHSITNLFSTHPPIKDRIARLQTMETKA